jgi:hypothetical protein
VKTALVGDDGARGDAAAVGEGRQPGEGLLCGDGAVALLDVAAVAPAPEGFDGGVVGGAGARR